MNVPPSAHARTLRCRAVATVQLRQCHHNRDLEPIGGAAVQDPDDTLLSEDREPHPSEILLAALSACLTVSIQANAVERRVSSRKLEVHSRGDADPSALSGGQFPGRHGRSVLVHHRRGPHRA